MIGFCILDSCTERFWCYWKEACLRQTWRWEESRPDVFVSAKATGERQNSSCWAVYRHVVHTHTYTHTLWESVHAHNIIEEYFYLFIFFKQFLKQMLLLSLTVLPGSSARSDQIRPDQDPRDPTCSLKPQNSALPILYHQVTITRHFTARIRSALISHQSALDEWPGAVAKRLHVDRVLLC